MATGAFIVATGIDGRPSYWPANAICCTADGVYKDARGRVVTPPVGMPRIGTAMDSAQLVAKPVKSNDSKNADREAMRVAIKLLPQLIELLSADDPEGADDAESENADLFDEPVEPSIDDAADPEAVVCSVFASDFYKQERERWAGINRNNAARRGQGYAPVAANASKGH